GLQTCALPIYGEPHLELGGLKRDRVIDGGGQLGGLAVRIHGSRIPLHARAARVHVAGHVHSLDVVKTRVTDAAPSLAHDVSGEHLLYVAVTERPTGDRSRFRLDRRMG